MSPLSPLSPQPFSGQTALITGAGSGIGAAVAHALAAQGARLVLAGRRAAPLETLAAALPAAQPVTIPTDVSDPAQVARLMAGAIAATGRVDILVNAAGIFQMRPVKDTPLALFDETLAVNLRGAFLCCQALWPHLQAQGGGQIVNLGSVAGVEAYPGNAAYGASKHGLNGLSGVLALEGRKHHIRVLVVCPAATDTEVWDGQATAAVRARMMPAAAVADLIAYLLASPRTLAYDPIVLRNFNDPWAGG